LIHSSITPYTAWENTDTRVSLAGSIGSYVLKLDKTVPTNGVSVYLTARTMGLTSNSKHIYYSICPR